MKSPGPNPYCLRCGKTTKGNASAYCTRKCALESQLAHLKVEVTLLEHELRAYDIDPYYGEPRNADGK